MIIKIKPYDNGGHANQSTTPKNIPDGWAVVPDDMETPNFPFGEVEVADINGVMTVTKWTPGTVPETEPIIEEPSIDTIIDTLLGVSE